ADRCKHAGMQPRIQSGHPVRDARRIVVLRRESSGLAACLVGRLADVLLPLAEILLGLAAMFPVVVAGSLAGHFPGLALDFLLGALDAVLVHFGIASAVRGVQLGRIRVNLVLSTRAYLGFAPPAAWRPAFSSHNGVR